MKLENLKILYKFFKKHRNAESILEYWKTSVENANWTCIEDIKKNYPKTRFDLPGKKEQTTRRMVFKLGLHWRVDVMVSFKNNKMFIKRVGTHEKYNKWKYDN